MDVDRFFSKLSKYLKKEDYSTVEMIYDIFKKHDIDCKIFTAENLFNYSDLLKQTKEITRISEYHHFLFISKYFLVS